VGIVLFNEEIHLTNATGIMVTMLGTIWFSYIQFKENPQTKERNSSSATSGLSSSHNHSQTSVASGVSNTVSGVASAVGLDKNNDLITLNSETSKSNK